MITWGGHGERFQAVELLGNILEIDGIAQVRQTRTARQGSKPLRKLANISRGVVILNMIWLRAMVTASSIWQKVKN